MTREVKEEIFGSRPSFLEPIFKANGIKYLKNTWLVTCRGQFNENKSTRYLFIFEFFNLDGLENAEFPTNLFSKSMMGRIYGVFVDEKEKKIYWKSMYNDIKEYTYEDYRELIVKLTKCKYIKSSARGSEHATPFSRFFRENMGKGFTLTDIDFILPNKNIFIEEKTFVRGEKGYIGWGQCLSLKELGNDVLNEDARLYIIFVDRLNNRLYIVEGINDVDCSRNIIKLERWGKMVKIELEKSLSAEEFIKWIKS